MVYTLVDKVYKLSDKIFHNDNLIKIKSFLRSNAYPNKFIEFYIKKRLDTLHYREKNNIVGSSGIVNNIDNQKMKLCLPHNNNLFYRVKNAVEPYNIQVVAKPNYMFSQIIVRGKDKLNKFQQPNKVYKIECMNCDASYVGESKRELGVRLKEHFENYSLDDDKHSVVTDHRKLGHKFNWKGVKVLDTEQHYHKRIFSESFHIKSQKNSLNKQEDSNKLHPAFSKLIHVLKCKNII